jgi:hypothetical protein
LKSCASAADTNGVRNFLSLHSYLSVADGQMITAAVISRTAI